MNPILRILGMLVAAVFWMIAGGLALFGLAMALTLGIMPLFIYFTPALALLLLVVFGAAMQRVRRRRAAIILTYLEQAVRLNLPLTPMLEAAQRSERGATARHLGELHASLADGVPMSDAVAAHVPAVSERSVGLLAAAERIGRLPAVLHRLLRHDRDHRLRDTPEASLAWSYGVVVLLFTLAVFGGAAIFVGPKFTEIFDDFDVAMPWVTQVTLDLAIRYGPPLVLIAMVGALAVAGRAVWSVFHSAEPTPPPWAPVTDRLVWALPVARAVVRDRGLADACEVISEALRAGAPMHEAAREAAGLPVNTVLCGRLRRFAERLTQGESLRDAAKGAALPRLMVGLLGTAEASADAQRVFAFLTRYYTGRFSRAAELARAGLMPAVVLVLAVGVGWIVLSMFLPLVRLIESTNIYHQGVM